MSTTSNRIKHLEAAKDERVEGEKIKYENGVKMGKTQILMILLFTLILIIDFQEIF